jgi:hypothetical protein
MKKFFLVIITSALFLNAENHNSTETKNAVIQNMQILQTLHENYEKKLNELKSQKIAENHVTKEIVSAILLSDASKLNLTKIEPLGGIFIFSTTFSNTNGSKSLYEKVSEVLDKKNRGTDNNATPTLLPVDAFTGCIKIPQGAPIGNLKNPQDTLLCQTFVTLPNITEVAQKLK